MPSQIPYKHIPEDVLKEAAQKEAESSANKTKEKPQKNTLPNKNDGGNDKGNGAKETKQRRLFKKRRAGVVLTREEVREIKQGRKKLRQEMKARGIKSKREFEVVAGSLGLYFDKRRGGLLLWLFRHWLGTLIASLIALLAILLIFSGVIYMSGFYTINLSDGMFKEGFTLSETIGFEDPGSVLMAQPAENVPCVSIKNIRKDVNEIDGLHNEDYFAYTYYIRNEGESTVSFDWELELNSETKNLSSAVWVALYLDGKLSIFARTNSKTGKQETLPPLEMTDRGYSNIPLMTTSPENDQFQLITQKGDIKYYRVVPKDYESENIIVSGRVEDVEPMEIHKYTVVLWLEGDDPDADNSKIGGHLGTQMNFRLVGEEKENDSYMSRLWKQLKFW